VTPCRRPLSAAIAALALAGGLGLLPVVPPAAAQPLTRLATTASALVHFPVFFSGRAVVVRGELRHQDHTLVLIGPGADKAIYLHFDGAAPDDGQVEIRGTMFDVGKLTEDDPRLSGVDVAPILQTETSGRWPASGDVLLIKVDQAEPARPPAAPTVRTVALDPGRYEDQRVTLVGRFRGANLYGDLPQAPGKSKWDFVLQSADAAIWVTGLRPRAKGLDLDPTARVDTGRDVEVSGVVKHQAGVVWLEGQLIAPAERPEDSGEPATIVPPQGPPPQVVFSAPIADDVDIAPSTTVRIQFSRDMKAGTFTDRVRVGYFGAAAAAVPPPPAFRTAYHDDARELEITFEHPLARFRTLRVQLLAGITALDGAPLAPWSLTFSVGAGAPAPRPAAPPHARAPR
jgi:hypothetical protein